MCSLQYHPKDRTKTAGKQQQTTGHHIAKISKYITMPTLEAVKLHPE